jgi:hypothetical protein
VSRVRGLSVNLRGAILEIPENWQTVALPGHNRQDGCDLSPQGPHTESGIAVAGELQSKQPWGYRLRFFWAAASAQPEHELRNERTLSASTGGGQIQWEMHGLRSGQWAGPWRCWWRGVKGKVCDGRALTLVAVRDPTVQEDCWKGQWGEADRGRPTWLRERRRSVEGRSGGHIVQWREVLAGVVTGGVQLADPYLEKHISIRMASARGLTTAALLARQLAQGRKVKQDQEQEAAQKAANDPAAWAAEVRRNALTKSAKEEERARGMTAAFVETEKAQATVEKLSARMQLLGLDHEALTGDVLNRVGELLSQAGMQPMQAHGLSARKDALRYQLLETMTAVMHTDTKLVLDTCVYPVKGILEQPKGKVVLIVTLPHGTQCTKNQIVSALRNLGEDVQVANVESRMSTTPTTAKTSSKTGKPFAPTIEIKLQGGGGLTPDLIEVIKNRQLVFTTDEGTRISGTVTVRAMYALEIHFNTQERSKIKIMWDILELLGLEAEGLNSLLTSGTRWGLEKVGLDEGLMCVRVTEERRVGDKVEPLRPNDISKMPQYGGPLFLAYFARSTDRDRVEACGALVDC